MTSTGIHRKDGESTLHVVSPPTAPATKIATTRSADDAPRATQCKTPAWRRRTLPQSAENDAAMPKAAS